MQQVQDKLDFAIDTPCDQELKERFGNPKEELKHVSGGLNNSKNGRKRARKAARKTKSRHAAA